MEFLNAFGRKTADATAKLTQQAKVLAETTLLQGLITEEKQKMVEQYTQIGKLYAANHRTDYEETFSDMMISIARSEDSIAGYKKQIQEVKGVVVCERCGEEVSKDTAFCSCCGAPIMDPEKYVRCAHCGTPMEKAMKFCTVCGNPRKSGNAAKHTCYKCGAEAPENAAFCAVCGNVLTKEEPAAGERQLLHTDSEVPDRSTEETVPTPPHRLKICPDCGAELADDVLFCMKCGRYL